MRDEVKRISKLVADGKLTPEDAADLIDAFYATEGSGASSTSAEPQSETETKEEGSDEAGAKGGEEQSQKAPNDPFKLLVDAIEKLGKDAESVNWNEVAKQARDSTLKGVDAIKSGLQDFTKGKVNFGWLFNQEVKTVEITFNALVTKTLRIENASGEVSIVGGAETGKVRAEATIRGSSPEEARAKAEAYTLVIEESDYQILIKQPEVTGLSVNLTIEIPTGMAVEVKSESGDISIKDTRAGAKIHSHDGRLTLSGLNGPIDVNADSGSLIISDVESSSLVIANKTGSLDLNGIKGSINARTASGQVWLKNYSGKNVALESVSGSIAVDLAEPFSGTMNLRVVSGNATLSLSDGNDVRVALSTLKGTVHCGFELADVAKTDQRVTGRLGAGNGSIDVSAVTGHIILDQRDAVK